MFGIEDFSKPLIDYSNFDLSQIKDVLIFGGSVLLIGVATIFLVLCILWLCLSLFKLVFHNTGKKEARKSARNTNSGNVEKSNDYTTSDQGEIIAVIAAAIAMAESENSDLKFRVVSFKRI